MVRHALLPWLLALLAVFEGAGAQDLLRLDGPGVTVRYRARHENAAIYCLNQYSEVRHHAEVLIGGQFKAPIIVELSDSAETMIARCAELGVEAVPEWAGGLAIAELRTAFLVVPSPHNYEWGLRRTLVHEVVHLLVADRVGAHPVPRWLDEGVAQVAEGYATANLWLALPVRAFFGWLHPMSKLDERFLTALEVAPALAYVQADSFTRFLEQRVVDGRLARIFDHLARGESIERALYLSTDLTFADLEAMWHGELKSDRTWMPWLCSQVGFGLVVFLMLVLVWPRARRRKAEADARMEQEDALADAEESEDGFPDGRTLRRMTGFEVRRLEEGEDEPRV